uniref:Egg protein CP391S-like protein n=1 Tax=Schistosoma mansoni TaxID=6183 RepID=A0AA82N7V6_SCHMA
MRYTLLFCQSITVYSIIFMISRFIKCHEICKKPELGNYAKVLFENDSYEYSHYYFYSQLIRLNQPVPVISGRFQESESNTAFNPKFMIKYYDSDFPSFYVKGYGFIEIINGEHEGVINNFLKDDHLNYVGISYLEISNNKEMLAIRQTYHQRTHPEKLTFNVTTLIHSNGKIAFYYHYVSKGIKGNQVKSGLNGVIKCENNEGNKMAETKVHEKWIQSGTLVEYELLGDCPKHNSTEECKGAKTCMWCEKARMCTAINHENIHEFKVNGCQVEAMSNVNVTSEATLNNHGKTRTGITKPDLRNELSKTTQTTESHLVISNVNVTSETTLINHEETTTSITEPALTNELNRTPQTTESVLNITTGTTENKEQRKSNNSLYIVIPLVILFLIVCIGCVAWLWLYRREKINPYLRKAYDRLIS